MNRIAKEIVAVAKELLVRATITVPRVKGVEGHSYNAIHYEVQRFLDRVRQNEGIDTLLARTDDSKAMVMKLGFTNHEHQAAIVREAVKLTSKLCARNGISEIRSAFENEETDVKEARQLLEMAKNMVAGTVTRTIRGIGWTEKEALDSAMSSDQDEYGHGEGYGGGYGSMREVLKTKMLRKPKPAKRVKIEKATVRKGPVKKAYVLSKKWGGDRRGKIDNDRRLSQKYETQGDALRAARELALEYGDTISVDLQAFCVGDTHLANVSAVGGQIGEWAFEVDFRE